MRIAGMDEEVHRSKLKGELVLFLGDEGITG